MTEKTQVGSAFRDAEGNVYFVDSATLAKLKVTDPKLAVEFGKHIDKAGTPIGSPSAPAATGLTVTAANLKDVLSGKVGSVKGITERVGQSVLLW